VSARFIGDEFDFNLSALASWLVIVVVIVVCGRWTLALDASTLAASTIANGVVVEARWRTLVVLICDVGHCNNV